MPVTETWEDLTRVLCDIAPDTAGSFLPPAPAADVEAAEAATDLVWPDQLREFFTLHDGQRPCGTPGYPDGGQLLPHQNLFGVDQVLSERGVMIEVWQGITAADPDYFVGGYDGLASSNPYAGSKAGGFLPQYIPLSGEDGNFYFCDLRPGPHHGCIRLYDSDMADCSGPMWESVSALLEALRFSLEGRTAFRDVFESVWRVTDGHLWWRPTGPEPDSRYD